MSHMDRGVVLRYYKQKPVQEAIIACAQDKEIAVKFGDKGFGTRPDTLVYPRDVLEFVLQGATSFHCSEELWENPMRLHTGMKKQEVDGLRKGWDLVLDIDCAFLEYSQIVADLLVQAIRYHGIEDISIKFSGNHGFHMGIPFESFPAEIEGKATKLLFPDGPRKIAGYLKEMVREHLAKRILQKDDLRKIQEKSGKSFGELVTDGKFDPYSILDIDTILISSRHLYRMPYSFNEKAGLISIPIDADKILQFKKEDAAPDKVEVKKSFLKKGANIQLGAGRKLIVQAFDFKVPQYIIQVDQTKISPEREYEEIKVALGEEHFPPCIKKILEGLEDGKKRAMFLLVNFLSSVGWDAEQIQERLKEWNNNNSPPLSETLLVGQVRYHKQHKKKVLPANCDTKHYYLDMGVCLPDNLCQKIKNPVNYAIRKARYGRREDGKNKEK